ncbi:MAG: hypothetical protein LUD02_15770 [Tannerellaceae bacterium]|nr:hypothetical protein [Tannerellaceae bacterium]
MNKDNNFGRLIALLFITLFACLALYWLPDILFGYKIKKVDLLADIRVKPQSFSMDSLRVMLEQPDTLEMAAIQAVQDSLAVKAGLDSAALVVRDSLYRAIYSVQEADSLGIRIEDYSTGHIGLKRFFDTLAQVDKLNRPVRIAFMGDSFIEGDIMVADFRNELQKLYGGRGVGFIPIQSKVAQFRPTVEQKSDGWKTWSMLSDREEQYTILGMVFEPVKEGASVSVKTVKRYPALEEFSSLKLLYEQNVATHMELFYNDREDTLKQQLPATSLITQFEIKDAFRKATFRFNNVEGFRALGLAMEDITGIVVDNFSLRGNSGLILQRLNADYCQALNEIRPYDLIIMQYGLNVVNADMLQYGWYTRRMVEIIRHMQQCFPDTDILLLGVSDRSYQENGEFETMPAVLALLHAQRQAARRAGISFWNVFGAMGGENSMVRFVENNWASKDYTHLSFRGGRELATALVEALLLEKEFYDEAEKVVNE